MVKFLLEAGADQEHKTDEMHTALMEASMDGHVEVARLLLDSGAEVNMPTDSFESPLTLAACGGHVDLAKLLLERGANIEEVNDEGYTPLMEASREGHEEMAALLVSQGANINAQTEETQETALTLACCGGFLEVADFLLRNTADLELGASTPLMEAAQEGHKDLVRFLLERNANVHAQTQTGDTALTYACENGHTDVAEILLNYGAELEHESEGGRTPLMKACRAGHLCTIKFLLSKGANINRQSGNNDHTPLSLACAGGHQAVVELLLKHGADSFHKLKDNSTMLIEASKGGHLNVVQLLLDYPEKKTVRKAATNKFAQKARAKLRSIQHKIDNDLQQIAPTITQQNQIKQLQNTSIQQHKTAVESQLNVTPKGASEIVHITNQDFYPCQIPKSDEQSYDAIIANSINTTLIDPNGGGEGGASIQTQDSIVDNIKMLQNQGFKDGLAFGLSHFSLVNGGTTVFNNIQSENNRSISTGINSPSSNIKQKLFLRKNKSLATPFEMNTGLESCPQFSLDLKDVPKLNTDRKIDSDSTFLDERPIVSI